MNVETIFTLVVLIAGIIFSLIAIKITYKKEETKCEESDSQKCKVNVKIVYDNIQKLYYVYYNGYCVKAEYTFDKAKKWSEDNIENFLKGQEVKYEKDYKL